MNTFLKIGAVVLGVVLVSTYIGFGALAFWTVVVGISALAWDNKSWVITTLKELFSKGKELANEGMEKAKEGVEKAGEKINELEKAPVEDLGSEDLVAEGIDGVEDGTIGEFVAEEDLPVKVEVEDFGEGETLRRN